VHLAYKNGLDEFAAEEQVSSPSMTATRASMTPISAFSSDVRVSVALGVVVGLVVVGLGLISPGAVAG